MTFDLKTLRPGDVIRVTSTDRVVASATDGSEIVTRDEKSGLEFFILQRDIDSGTTKIEVLKRAARKPKVGDTVTGRQAKAIQWKRGSVLRTYRDWVIVLGGDGRWFAAGTEDPLFFTFDEFDGVHDSEFEVVYLP